MASDRPAESGDLQQDNEADEGMGVALAMPLHPLPAVPVLHRPDRPGLSEEQVNRLSMQNNNLHFTPVLGAAFDELSTRLEEGNATDHWDEPMIKLSEHFLQPTAALHASKQALGKLLQLHPTKIEPRLNTLAATLVHTDGQERYELEKALANSTAKKLLYLDLTKFDETPMKLTNTEYLNPGTGAGSRGPSIASAASPAATKASLSEEAVAVGKASTLSKLLATENRFAMLMKTSLAESESSDVHYLLFTGTQLTTLQIVERATGAVLKKALTQNMSISEHVEQFQEKIRVCTADLAGANAVAERMVLADRPSTWSQASFPCNVHIVARCHSKTFCLVQEHVHGLIHFSLSLNAGASMQRFRRSLVAVLTSSKPIVILRGAPPADAEVFRHFILDLFCKTGTKVALRQYLLKRLPNGDWRRRDGVEVYVPPGLHVDEDQLQRQLVTALLLCLGGRSFRTYPVHRWVGCDLSTDLVGLCESVHGLASAAYSHMMLHWSAQESQSSTQVPNAPADRVEPGLAEHFQNVGEQGSAEELAPAAVMAVAFGPEQAAAATSELGSEAGLPTLEFAALNSRSRRIAAKWLGSKPLPYLMAIRLFMRPLVKLLSTYLTRSGHAWRVGQEAATSEFEQGQSGSPGSSAMLEYVHLSAEQLFMQELQGLLSDPCWQFFDKHVSTLEFESLLFRMSSRAGCLVEELLMRPARSSTHRLLRLVSHPHAQEAQAILETRQCCQDDLVKKHLQLYPDEQLLSQDSLAALTTLALLAATETVGVEWGHGRVHRLVKKSSVQTHTPTTAFVGAQWLCQRAVHRGKQTLSPPEASKPVAQAAPSASALPVLEERPAKKRRGGGGAFRAFVSQATRGQKGSPDLGDIAQQYQTAKAQASPAYLEAQRVGAAATERHRSTTATSFGPKTRAARKAALLQFLRKRALAPHLPIDMGMQIEPSSPEGEMASWRIALSGEMTQVRREVIATSRAKRQQVKDRAQRLASRSQEQQPLLRNLIYQVFPDLLSLGSHLQWAPMNRGLQPVHVVFDIKDRSQAIASWALGNSRWSNLNQQLQTWWQRQHSAIMEEGPEAPVPKDLTSDCCRLGFCVTSEFGMEANDFRLSLLKHLKQQFPRRDVEQHHLLLDNHIVLELIESTVTVDPDDPWADVADELLREAQPEQHSGLLSSPVLLHVGLLYLKPYRPSFQRLVKGQDMPGGRMECLQTGEFFSDIGLAYQLNLKSKWSVRLHQVVSSRAPLAKLNPRRCVLRPCSGSTAAIWPVLRKRRGKDREVRRRTQRGARRGGSTDEPHSMGGPDQSSATEPLPAAASPEQDEAETDNEDLDDLLQNLEESDGSEEAGVGELDELMDDHLQEWQQSHTIQEHLVDEEGEDEVGEEAPPLEEILQDNLHEMQAAPVAEEVEEALEMAAAPGGPPDVAQADADAAPEAPPAPMPDVAAALLRQRAELKLEVPGGLLTFYETKKYFTASCRNPAHGRCILTRSSEPGTRASQGRPLGLLTAWLFLGQDLPDKASHRDRSIWPNHAVRTYHRELLAELPGSSDLLDQERALEPGESAEPDLAP